MSVEQRISDDKKTIAIRVAGRFDYSLHRTFRSAYKDVQLKRALYKLDLSATEYIDSSALGMLLLLKEHAEALDSKVILLRPSPVIYKILSIANFTKIFDIEK